LKSDLIKLEQEALALRNSGNLKRAAELFASIVAENPDYEHGECFYNLAGCYEDLGELNRAEENYRRALDHEPKNPYFLGGYASFLFLHRDARSAFAEYRKLWKVEHYSGNTAQAEKALLGLRELGKRLGLSDQELTQEIESDNDPESQKTTK
jgi:Tfp pilus assembly protein PilF